MRKSNLFFKSLSALIITFGIAGCAIGGDDKENEIVKDPLTQSEYYIVGTVKNSNGAISNATVTISNDIKTTTNTSGIYTLTVSEAKTYKLAFTAEGHEAFETTTDIASGAANHSQITVNVKLAKALVFGAMSPANGATIEIPKLESATQEKAGTISIPTDGTDAATKITSVAFEETRIANPGNSVQPQQSQASNYNIAIKTDPANAVAAKDITIAIPNPSAQANQGYFNTNDMVVESTTLPATRAASPKVKFENNSYVITIPKGENIAGKYRMKMKFTKQADNAVAEGYNSVNGKSEVFKLENRDYSAQNNIPLKVLIKTGWDYTTTPAKALKDAGASDALAAEINKYIEDEEGGKSGSYEIEQNLVTSISGNHVLYYESKCMIRIKTYTFNIVVNEQNKVITITLKSYAGHQEKYTNNPISQHSGGGTGSNS